MSRQAKSHRLGVLGGTFDPVHVGHLSVAVEARHALALDRVLVVVANLPWQKTASRPVTSAEDRWAMVEAAVADLDGVEASRIEIERGGESYTVDTLEALAGAGHELFLIVGSDVAAELDTWVRHDDVRRLASVVVVERPGGPPPPDDLQTIPIPRLDVSSSDLRVRVSDGRPLDVLVPAPALRVLRERGLYAG